MVLERRADFAEGRAEALDALPEGPARIVVPEVAPDTVLTDIRVALRLLERDGILITCSCSHHFTEADLLEAVAAASLDAGRTLRVLERRTQAKDHPILLTVPETHYLKCLVLQVV